VAITGAPFSRSTPVTVAVPPCTSICAPMRISSGACMNRFSKIRSPARCPLGGAQQRHHLRLQIGGKAGEGFGRHIDGAHAAVLAADLEARSRSPHRHAGRVELFTEAPDQLDPPPSIPPRRRDGGASM
jgi:hypothetical protein